LTVKQLKFYRNLSQFPSNPQINSAKFFSSEFQKTIVSHQFHNSSTSFPASSRLLAAQVQKPAPDFAGTAVLNNDFKEIKLADFKGGFLVGFSILLRDYPINLI
jgi:hypothetical protein